MLGDASAKFLLQVFGYLYPGYMCFKDLEQNNSDRCRLWSMYWVLMAALTAVTPIADTFLFFIPFYYTAKVAFAIYLWANNLAGTQLIYTRYVHPLITRHEPVVDSKIAEIKGMVTQLVHSNAAVFVSWLQQKFVAALAHTHQAAANGLKAEPAGEAAPAAYPSASSFHSASSSGLNLRSYSTQSNE